MRFVWLMGLLIAIGASAALVLLPFEAFIVPLVALVLGLVLFGIGVFLRFRHEKKVICDAMRRYAATNQGDYHEALTADQIPTSISLIRSANEHRCTNAITSSVLGRPCLLFLLERSGVMNGEWRDHYMISVPKALPGIADFRLDGTMYRGQIVLIMFSSLLISVLAIVQFALSRSTPALVTSLTLGAFALILGAVLYFGVRNSDADSRIPSFLDKQILDQFWQQGLCAECVDGNLAIWTDRLDDRPLLISWKRSFQSVDKWVAVELHGLVKAASQVITRAAPADDDTELVDREMRHP